MIAAWSTFWLQVLRRSSRPQQTYANLGTPSSTGDSSKWRMHLWHISLVLPRRMLLPWGTKLLRGGARATIAEILHRCFLRSRPSGLAASQCTSSYQWCRRIHDKWLVSLSNLLPSSQRSSINLKILSSIYNLNTEYSYWENCNIWILLFSILVTAHSYFNISQQY
jgi:hypothetical protein